MRDSPHEYQYHHPHNGEDKYFRITQFPEYGSHEVISILKDLQKSKNWDSNWEIPSAVALSLTKSYVIILLLSKYLRIKFEGNKDFLQEFNGMYQAAFRVRERAPMDFRENIDQLNELEFYGVNSWCN